MSTALAKQIMVRMKAKNLSTLGLERAAGLKSNAVQNILRGKSKKPSAEILHAVAEILGCTVKELLSKNKFFQDDNDNNASKEELLNRTYYPSLLLEKVASLVNTKASRLPYQLTNHQILTYIEEIYLHALANDAEMPDEEFFDWFLEMMRE